MKVYLLVLFTNLPTIAGQVILKLAITDPKPLLQQRPIEFLWGGAFSPRAYDALVLQGRGYLTWGFVTTREESSRSHPRCCAS